MFVLKFIDRFHDIFQEKNQTILKRKEKLLL